MWPVASRIRVLYLPETGASDANVAYQAREMLNMARLNPECTSVSNETARAVSSLDKIIEAHRGNMKISDVGVQALAGGVACQSLENANCGNVQILALRMALLMRSIVRLPRIRREKEEYFRCRRRRSRERIS